MQQVDLVINHWFPSSFNPLIMNLTNWWTNPDPKQDQGPLTHMIKI